MRGFSSSNQSLEALNDGPGEDLASTEVPIKHLSVLFVDFVS